MNNDEKLLQLLNTSKCLSKKQLLNYRNGVLFPEELRAVELHLAECELCNFALEGFAHIKDPEQLINSLKMPVLPPQKVTEVKQEKKEVEKASVPNVIETAAEKSSRISNEESYRISNHYPEKKRSIRSILKIASIAAILLIGFGLIWHFELSNTKIDNSTLLAANDRTSDTNTGNIASSDTPMNPISTNKKVVIPEEEPDKQDPKVSIESAESDSNIVAIKSIAPETKVAVIAQKEEDKKVITDKKESGRANNKDVIIAKSDSKVEEQAKQKKESITTKSAGNNAPIIEKRAVNDQANKVAQQSDYEIGHALFKKKQYSSALLYLNTAVSDKNNEHHWDAVYYSALCNKNLNNNRKAKKLLKQIIKNNAPQKSAAEQQLEEIGGKDED